MASEVPPDPITTNYIPESWDEAMTATQRNKALEANYIKLSPQNYPITFLNSISVPISSTSDTRFATTSMIQTFWTALRSTSLVWSGKQSFSTLYATNIFGVTGVSTFDIGTDVTDNIEIGVFSNRTGELHLGDGASATGIIHIGNGTNTSNNVQILNGTGSTGTIQLGSATSTTRLNCPMTPTYTISIPFTQVAGNYTYGSSTKIGYTITQIVTSGYIGNGSNSTPILGNACSITVDVGVWFIQFELYSTNMNSSFWGIAISLTSASLTNSFGKKISNRGLTGSPNPNSLNSSGLLYASSAGTNVYGVVSIANWGIGLDKARITAIRIS